MILQFMCDSTQCRRVVSRAVLSSSTAIPPTAQNYKLHRLKKKPLWFLTYVIYRRIPVSADNTFQHLPRLRETADNTERYI